MKVSDTFTSRINLTTLFKQGSLTWDMSVTEKFSAIRKGLLELLILRIIATDKVYVVDILKRLSIRI